MNQKIIITNQYAIPDLLMDAITWGKIPVVTLYVENPFHAYILEEYFAYRINLFSQPKDNYELPISQFQTELSINPKKPRIILLSLVLEALGIKTPENKYSPSTVPITTVVHQIEPTEPEPSVAITHTKNKHSDIHFRAFLNLIDLMTLAALLDLITRPTVNAPQNIYDIFDIPDNIQINDDMNNILTHLAPLYEMLTKKYRRFQDAFTITPVSISSIWKIENYSKRAMAIFLVIDKIENPLYKKQATEIVLHSFSKVCEIDLNLSDIDEIRTNTEEIDNKGGTRYKISFYWKKPPPIKRVKLKIG